MLHKHQMFSHHCKAKYLLLISTHYKGSDFLLAGEQIHPWLCVVSPQQGCTLFGFPHTQLL